MFESIIVALITGGLSLVGVIMTNISGNKQIESKLMTAQAVTDAKLENLTIEVRKNNDLVNEIPVLRTQVEQLRRDVDNNDRIIDDLRRELNVLIKKGD